MPQEPPLTEARSSASSPSASPTCLLPTIHEICAVGTSSRGLTGRAEIRPFQVLAAAPAFIAQFERDLLIERTQSGLKRAKSEGKALGRPSTLSEKQKHDVRGDLATGMSVSAVARKFATSRQTIMRVRDALP